MTDLNQQDRADLADGEIIRILNTVDPRPFRDNDLLALNFAHAILNAARRQHSSAAQAVGYVNAGDVESLAKARDERGKAGDYIRMYALDDGNRHPVFAAPPVATQAAQVVESLEQCAVWIKSITPEQLEVWRDVKVAEIMRTIRQFDATPPTAPVVAADVEGVSLQDIMFEVFEYARISDGINSAEGEARHKQREAMLAQDRKLREMICALSRLNGEKK